MSAAAKARHAKEHAKDSSKSTEDIAPVVEEPIEIVEENFDPSEEELSEQEMLEELRRNQEEIERIEAAVAKRRLKDELIESRKKLNDVKLKSASKGKSASLSKNIGVNIGDLRRLPNLESEAERQMVNIGIDSDSDSDCSSPSLRNPVGENKKKNRSGIQAKSCDRVVAPQRWPHSNLQYRFASKTLGFNDLSQTLFIAGELEIISSSSVTASERDGRLSLLKRIVYFSDVYEWKGLLEYYAAIVRNIEMGWSTWSDDTRDMDTILIPFIKVMPDKKPGTRQQVRYSDANTSVSSNRDLVWFCSFYQRNKCSELSSHYQNIRGKNCKVEHICATCWQKDGKKLDHPECSQSCPNKLSQM